MVGGGGDGGGTGGEVDMRLLCAPVALVTGYGLLGVHCIGCLGIACLVDAVIRSILWICYECGIAEVCFPLLGGAAPRRRSAAIPPGRVGGAA